MRRRRSEEALDLRGGQEVGRGVLRVAYIGYDLWEDRIRTRPAEEYMKKGSCFSVAQKTSPSSLFGENEFLLHLISDLGLSIRPYLLHRAVSQQSSIGGLMAVGCRDRKCCDVVS